MSFIDSVMEQAALVLLGLAGLVFGLAVAAAWIEFFIILLSMIPDVSSSFIAMSCSVLFGYALGRVHAELKVAR